MKWMIVPLLAFACAGIAAGDIIIGPFDTTASFDPQEIVLAPGSGDFYVNVNLDWSWAQEIPFPYHYVSLQFRFRDASGRIAPEFLLPNQTTTVDGVSMNQINGGIYTYPDVTEEIKYIPMHIIYSGLSEGSYLVELDTANSMELVSTLAMDNGLARPTAEPLRITVVPEPCTLAIAGMGFLGLAWARRRPRKGIRK